jgi:prepilin-type processing-associated H-X9-DG protein
MYRTDSGFQEGKMKSCRLVKLVLWGIAAVVFISLFVPIRDEIRERHRRQCQINLEKGGQALRLYQNDYGSLPPEALDRWLTASAIYGEPKPCAAFYALDFGYGDNPLLGPKTSLDELAPQTALTWDGDQASREEMEQWKKSPTRPIPYFARKRHGRGANILLADGHAAFFYANAPTEKLLPFFDPEVAQGQTRLTIKEGSAP